MSDTGWYFAERGAQIGPVTRNELTEHIRLGRVDASTQVWHPSMANWAAVRDTELAAYLPQGAPPPALGLVPAGAAPLDRSLPGASFSQAFSRFWSKYVRFSGRASRSEYWFAVLAVFGMTLGAVAMDLVLMGSGTSDFGPFSTILNLALFLPMLALSLRRLHDIDRSAWWSLIGFVPLVGGIVLLVFACTEGTKGPNRFGA